ncbi:MAG: hypothetical protein NVSMB65_19920 [Chloroflexota bacterium]
MLRGTSAHYCRTCQQTRIVAASVRTVARPYAHQPQETRLVYVCRTCGHTVGGARLSA